MNGSDLRGQVAVVTGGNGGIGFGFAEGVAAAGADVAIWARNAAKTTEAVAHLEELGVRAAGISCDVADEASVAAAVGETVDRLGRIDICVANAGTTAAVPFLDLGFDEWRRVMAVNLDGAFLTVRDCARQMVAQGDGGAIVTISSTSAVHGAPANAHYGASKSGVLGLTKAAAVALARHRIRVNAVLPGWTITDLAAGGYESDVFREATTKRTPVRRWATGGDYRLLAAYLCDRTLDFHTGDSVVVDGGYTVY